MKRIIPILAIALIVLFSSCDPEKSGLNIFTVDDDVAFGKQMLTEVNSNSAYSPLDSTSNKEAYKYLYDIRDRLLAGGDVEYADKFSWKIVILNDSAVNAFATPGGYIFFYTGIFNVLENEAQLAGVMAHEMAHCARRHSTKQMTKKYGIGILLDIVLGKNSSEMAGMVASVAQGLADSKFSRTDEYEADEYAARYMSKTNYEITAIADFFDILADMQSGGNMPTFLSTHPSPEDRSEKIDEHKLMLGAQDGQHFVQEYENFLYTIF